jgi:hypothetical protein
MTSESEQRKQQQGGPRTNPRRTRKSAWDNAEVVVSIEYTRPGTALDDHLRKEQTRAVLDLLADYVRKIDKEGEIKP